MEREQRTVYTKLHTAASIDASMCDSKSGLCRLFLLIMQYGQPGEYNTHQRRMQSYTTSVAVSCVSMPHRQAVYLLQCTSDTTPLSTSTWSFSRETCVPWVGIAPPQHCSIAAECCPKSTHHDTRLTIVYIIFVHVHGAFWDVSEMGLCLLVSHVPSHCMLYYRLYIVFTL